MKFHILGYHLCPNLGRPIHMTIVPRLTIVETRADKLFAYF